MSGPQYVGRRLVDRRHVYISYAPTIWALGPACELTPTCLLVGFHVGPLLFCFVRYRKT